VGTGGTPHATAGSSAAQHTLVRHVAGYRLDRVEGLDLNEQPAWDAATLAQRLAAWIGTLDAAPDLVLVGREFGDDDDGVLPALLAEALRQPLVGQALALARTDTGWQVLRQHGAGLERLNGSGPAVIAVTNHAGNRLRHPLLKNVMAAKRLAFQMASLPAVPAGPALRLAGLAPTAVPRREKACRMLEGSPEAQAAQLARLLVDGVAA
jgi:electron transfer flavoprotein beta subunit